MDGQAEEEKQPADSYVDLINTFCEITSCSREEATFFLESHRFDLDSAVSTFLETSNIDDVAAAVTASPGVVARPSNPLPHPRVNSSPSYSPTHSPSDSPSRSRSPSPTAPRRAPTTGYSLRSRQTTKPSGSRTGGIRTFSDLNRRPSNLESDSDSDEPQEYYTGGEKSGMLVQDPSKLNDVEAIFKQARQAGATDPPNHQHSSSSTRSFRGTGRLLSGETVPGAPQPPEAITHTIIFWSNGFTVDDGPLRRLDDPANAVFLESIKNSDCPKELEPADRRIPVHVNLMRKEQDYSAPERQGLSHVSFQGQGRTLGGVIDSSVPPVAVAAAAAPSPTVAPPPSMGLVLNDALPTTSIQLRLADGTRMVARFNYCHTIRDIRSFIDASRSGGARNYQLQTVGFPPKQLANLDQTIEEAGIANSVVLQKP
ncbi:plant UBX domain-containing protein 4-like [Impatiens glandulifera]|uniref:plant UBX domain-containing protein 4-like n=1 Tax=Impatiens glandulifera TaxID=253017 RepID=UPI001FB14D41|nr:plant UBX domain-containing protein 4-like [Impatiens glandulifera]